MINIQDICVKKQRISEMKVDFRINLNNYSKMNRKNKNKNKISKESDDFIKIMKIDNQTFKRHKSVCEDNNKILS